MPEFGWDPPVLEIAIHGFPAVAIHLWGFLLGLFLMWWIGHLAAGHTVKRIRRSRTRHELGRARQLGLAERTFFGIGTVLSPPLAFAGMVAWTGLRLGASWGRVGGDDEDAAELQDRRTAALAGSVASLTFALLGGLLLRWSLPV